MDAIRTRGLHYRYNATHGVFNLDLRVPEGGIYAFLGPNGSGKTTTIRLLLGLLRPQAGTIAIAGRERMAAHPRGAAQVGALVEAPSLYPHLSGRRNLEVSRRLLGLPGGAVDAALERVGLLSAADRKVWTYSLGMRQRLGLALALLGSPRLLILDEPGNGLDPAGTLKMRALIRSLADDTGVTVFLSSHLLGEVEQVATHVGVITAGRLRFQGTMEQLLGRSRGPLRLESDAPAVLLAHLAELGIAARPSEDGATLVEESHMDDQSLLRALVQRAAPLSAFHRVGPGLESIFFDLTCCDELEDA